MEETIIKARKTRCSDDPAQTWDWIKHRMQDVLVDFSKKRSKEKKGRADTFRAQLRQRTQKTQARHY
jgi:hypothetical protein